jgi:hypothetical protein
VYEFLKSNQLLDIESYQKFLESQGQIKRHGHYLNLTLSDGSIMTMRAVYEGKRKNSASFIHIHPSRHSPHTFRIRANTLKTAIMVYFLACCRRVSPFDVALLNEAREKLKLSLLPEIPSAIQEMLEKLTDSKQE